MIRKMQIIGYLGASTVALGAATLAFALDEPMDVTARFRLALTLTEVNPIEFSPGTGSIDFANAASLVAGTDFVRMATNGALSFGGTLLTSALAAGGPGRVDIAGEGSTSVDVSCDSAGVTLDQPGVGGVQLDFSEASIKLDTTGTGAAQGAHDDLCAGLGVSPFPYTLSAGGAGVVTIGGRVDAIANMPSALYSTANPEGVAFNLRVVYTP